MRRFVVALFVSLLSSIPMMSQDKVPPVAMWSQAEAPKAAVFGGYSYLRNGGNNSAGWDGPPSTSTDISASRPTWAATPAR
jgi:hypothetical protein